MYDLKIAVKMGEFNMKILFSDNGFKKAVVFVILLALFTTTITYGVGSNQLLVEKDNTNMEATSEPAITAPENSEALAEGEEQQQSETSQQSNERDLNSPLKLMQNNYTVNKAVYPEEGGQIVSEDIVYGANTTTVKVEANYGYVLDYFAVNGKKVSLNSDGTYMINLNIVSDESGVVLTEAYFKKADLSYSFIFDPAMGSVIIDEKNITQSDGRYEGRAAVDQKLILKSAPFEGYQVMGWYVDGKYVAGGNTYEFTPLKDGQEVKLVTERVADPSIKYFNVIIKKQPLSAGHTITGDGKYPSGSLVSLSVTGNEELDKRWVFIGWLDEKTGRVVSKEKNYQFTVNSNTNLIAQFTEKTYSIKEFLINGEVAKSDGSQGAVISMAKSGDNTTFYEGEKKGVICELNKGWRFIHWEDENGNLIGDNPYSPILTFTGSKDFSANALIQQTHATVKVMPTVVADGIKIHSGKAGTNILDNVELNCFIKTPNGNETTYYGKIGEVINFEEDQNGLAFPIITYIERDDGTLYKQLDSKQEIRIEKDATYTLHFKNENLKYTYLVDVKLIESKEGSIGSTNYVRYSIANGQDYKESQKNVGANCGKNYVDVKNTSNFYIWMNGVLFGNFKNGANVNLINTPKSEITIIPNNAMPKNSSASVSIVPIIDGIKDGVENKDLNIFSKINLTGNTFIGEAYGPVQTGQVYNAKLEVKKEYLNEYDFIGWQINGVVVSTGESIEVDNIKVDTVISPKFVSKKLVHAETQNPNFSEFKVSINCNHFGTPQITEQKYLKYLKSYVHTGDKLDFRGSYYDGVKTEGWWKYNNNGHLDRVDIDQNYSVTVQDDLKLLMKSDMEESKSAKVYKASSQGGSISISGSQKPVSSDVLLNGKVYDEWNYLTKATYLATPKKGYKFEKWLLRAGSNSSQNIEVYEPTLEIDIKNSYYEINAVFNEVIPVEIDVSKGGTVYIEGSEVVKDKLEFGVPENTTINFMAEPEQGYRFTGWYDDSGKYLGEDKKLTVKPTVKTIYYANFCEIGKEVSKLKINLISYNGTEMKPDDNVYVENNRVEYPKGEQVSLTARYKDNNAMFMGWYKKGVAGFDLVSSQENYTFTASGDEIELNCVYYDPNYFGNLKRINLVKNIATGGDLYGGWCKTENNSTTIDIGATVNPGFVFVGWEAGGEIISDSQKHTIKFQGEIPEKYKNITAIYDVKKEVLSISGSNSDVGSVTVDQYEDKIDNDYYVLYGSTVTLQATPEKGYRFAGWIVDDKALSQDSKIKILANKSYDIKAVFLSNPINIKVSDNLASLFADQPKEWAEGLVLNYGEGYYEKNQNARIGTMKTSTSGALDLFFSHWTDSNAEIVSYDEVFDYKVVKDESLVANYVRNLCKVDVAVGPERGGIVSGGGAYSAYTYVKLEAKTHSNYTFDKWVEITKSGDVNNPDRVIGTDPNMEVQVTKDMVIRGLFIKDSFEFGMFGSPVDTVTVEESGNTENYEGTLKQIKASSSDKSNKFKGWYKSDRDGNIIDKEPVSTKETYEFVLTESTWLTAIYERTLYKVELSILEGANSNGDSVMGSGYVTLNGSKKERVQLIEEGGMAFAAAYPSKGFEFDGWVEISVENDKLIQTPFSKDEIISFSVKGDIQLVAIFKDAAKEKYTFNLTALNGQIKIEQPNKDTDTLVAGFVTVDKGANVTLTAIEKDVRYKFIGWSLDEYDTSSVNTSQIFSTSTVMALNATADIQLYANFKKEEAIPPKPTDKVNIKVSGLPISTTEVFVNGAKVSLASPVAVTAGSIVKLDTSSSAVGYKFKGWEDDENRFLSSSAKYNFYAKEEVTLYAKWGVSEQETAIIYGKSNPSVGGTVSLSTGAGVVVSGASVEISTASGGNVTLEAKASTYKDPVTGSVTTYKFKNWQSSNNERKTDSNFTINNVSGIAIWTANFEKVMDDCKVTLAAVAAVPKSGNVKIFDKAKVSLTGGQLGTLSGTSISAVVSSGSILNAEVLADSGYSFSGWYDKNGNLLSGEKNYKMLVTTNSAAYAAFALDPKVRINMQSVSYSSQGGVVSSAVNEYNTSGGAVAIYGKDASSLDSRSELSNAQATYSTQGGVFFVNDYIKLYAKETIMVGSGKQDYSFMGWYEDGVLLSKELEFNYNISKNTTVSGVFEKDSEMIAIGTRTAPAKGDDGGSVGIITGGGIYPKGTEVTLEAASLNNGKYAFKGWHLVTGSAVNGKITTYGALVSAAPKITVSAVNHSVYTAIFGENTYDVKLSITPAAIGSFQGGGTVAGEGNYVYGDTVKLVASANDFYSFAGWYTVENNVVSKTAISTGSAYTFEIKENKEFLAVFNRDKITVTSSANPTEGGMTVLNSSGSSVTVDGGDGVTAVATPNTKYSFKHWVDKDKKILSTNSVYSFVPKKDCKIYAVFDMKDINLKFSAVDKNGFVITDQAIGYLLTGAGIDREADSQTYKGTFSYNESVTVKAQNHEAQGIVFNNWSWNDENGRLSTSIDEILSVNATDDKEYKANYSTVEDCYYVKAEASPDNLGKVHGTGYYNKEGVSTGAVNVVLTAVPNNTAIFSHWQNETPEHVSSSSALILSKDDLSNHGGNNMTYTAVFKQVDYVDITLSPMEEGTGTVYATGAESVSKDGTGKDGAWEGRFKFNSEAVLKAVPAEGYVFAGWIDDTGVTVSPESTYKITAKGNFSYVAEFILADNAVSLKVLADPSDTAYVAGTGIYDKTEEPLAIAKAIPNLGYAIDKWVYGDGTEVTANEDVSFYDNNVMINLKQDTTLIAKTKQVQPVKVNIGTEVYALKDGNYGKKDTNFANTLAKPTDESEFYQSRTATVNVETETGALADGYVFKEWRLITDGKYTGENAKAVTDEDRMSASTNVKDAEAYSTNKEYSFKIIDFPDNVTFCAIYEKSADYELSLQVDKKFHFGQVYAETTSGGSLISTGAIGSEKTGKLEKLSINQKVTLGAIENIGTGTFQGWEVNGRYISLDDSGVTKKELSGDNYYEKVVTVQENLNIKGFFKAPTDTDLYYSLDLQWGGDGKAGSLEGGGLHKAGERVTVTANESASKRVYAWYDSSDNIVEEGNTYTVTVNRDMTLTAKTAIREFEVRLDSSPITTAVNLRGDGWYKYGDKVTIKAEKEGIQCKFEYWSESYVFDGLSKVSKENQYTFTIKDNMHFTANYKTEKYPVEGKVAGGEGKVTIVDAQVQIGGLHVGGAIATALPGYGYKFKKWKLPVSDKLIIGEKGKDSSVITFAVLTPLVVTAHMAPKTITVKPITQNASKGTVMGGGVEEFNDHVTVTAKSNYGYSFEGWYLSNKRLSNKEEFKWKIDNVGVAGVVTLEARFDTNKYKVEVESSDKDKGTVSGGGKCEYSSDATVKAKPKDGYGLYNWTDANGKEVSKDKEYTFKVEGDTTLKANFDSNCQVNVSTNDAAAGKVEGGGTYVKGSTAELKAVANPGYHFTGWKKKDGGDVLSTAEEYGVKVEASGNDYVGNFEVNTCNIKVGFTPSKDDAIQIKTSVGGIEKTITSGINPSTQTLTQGAVLQLTAITDDSNTFIGWYDESDTQVTAEKVYSYTVEGEKTFTAKFNPVNIKLSTHIDSTGDGKGTIIINGKKVDSISLQKHDSVELEAVPETLDNSNFHSWKVSGSAVIDGKNVGHGQEFSTAAALTIDDVGSDICLVAKFGKTEEALVLASVSNGAMKATTSTAMGYTKGSEHFTFDNSQPKTVTLEAIANYGYVFEGWYKGEIKPGEKGAYTINATGGAVSTATAYGVTINGSASTEKVYAYVASFKDDPDVFEVKTSVNIPDLGEMYGGGFYASGSSVTVVGTGTILGSDYVYDGLYENETLLTNNYQYTFNITRDMDIQARYILDPQPLVLATSISNAGILTGAGTYAKNSDAAFSVTPNEGYKFMEWQLVKVDGSGVFHSNTTTSSIKMDGPKILVAKMEPLTGYGLSCNVYTSYTGVSANNVSLSAVSGESQTLGGKIFIDTLEEGVTSGAIDTAYKSTHTLKAVANDGFRFVGWTKGASVSEGRINISDKDEITLTMTTDTAVYANFEARQYDIRINSTSGVAIVGISSSALSQNVITGSGVEIGEDTYVITYGEPVTVFVGKADLGQEYSDFNGWLYNGKQVTNRVTSSPHALAQKYDFVASENADLEAKFSEERVLLALSTSDFAAGKVSGAGVYYAGNNVTVTAVANPGYSFKNWTDINDSVVTTDAIFTTAMAFSAAYVANFNVVSHYAIGITMGALGQGRIDTANDLTSIGDTWDAGYVTINDKATTQAINGINSRNILKAGNLTGYVFVGWATSPAFTSTGAFDESSLLAKDKTFNINLLTTNVALYAIFDNDNSEKATVTLASTPSGIGEISGGGNYSLGEMVTVKSKPQLGYKFVGWKNLRGQTVSIEENYTFKLENNTYLLGEFAKVPTYTVKGLSHTSASGVTSGNSIGTTGGIIYVNGKIGSNVTVNQGDSVGLNAKTKEGYIFNGWSEGKSILNGGTILSTETGITVSAVDSNKELWANFTVKTVKASVSASSVGAIVGIGHKTDDGREIVYTTGAGVEATLEVAYGETIGVAEFTPEDSSVRFVAWFEKGHAVSEATSAAIRLTEDREFTAVFGGSETYYITAIGSPASGIDITGAGPHTSGGAMKLQGILKPGYKLIDNNPIVYKDRYGTSAAIYTVSNGAILVTSNAVTASAAYTFYTEKEIYKVKAAANPAYVAQITGSGDSFNYGDKVTLKAIPNQQAEDYVFLGWYEGAQKVCDTLSYSFSAEKSRQLVAMFEKQKVEIKVISDTPNSEIILTGAGIYEAGDNIKLEAASKNNLDYRFVRWEKIGTDGKAETLTSKQAIEIPLNKIANDVKRTETYKAVFYGLKKYDVNISTNMTSIGAVTASGLNSATSSGANGGLTGIVSEGQTVTLTALENSDYKFVGWFQGNTRVESKSQYAYVANENLTLEAKYVDLNNRLVTVTAAPSDGGQVYGEGIYKNGSRATVIAVPSAEYDFEGWVTKSALTSEMGIQIISKDKTYIFEVTTHTALAAKFKVKTFDVTVSKTPEIGGTVSGGGFGIQINNNTTVTATPNQGFDFQGWYTVKNSILSKNAISTSGSFTFPVTENLELRGVFKLKENVTVKGSVKNNKGGTITMSSGAETTKPGTEGELYIKRNSQIDLKATPDVGYHFVDWRYEKSGIYSTNSSITISAIANINLIAAFDINEYEITSRDKTEDGAFSATGTAIIEGGSTFEHGEQVTAKAKAGANSSFVGWFTMSGGAISQKPVSENEEYKFTAVDNLSLVGVFKDVKHTVLTGSLVPQGGTVTGSAMGAGELIKTEDYHGVKVYAISVVSGVEVVATASALTDKGYQFVGWVDENGTIKSSNPILKFTVSGNGVYLAKFEKFPCDVEISVNDQSMGTATLNEKAYRHGDKVEATANANKGFVFKEWLVTDGGIATTVPGISASDKNSTYSANVTTDMAIKALFEKQKISIAVEGAPKDKVTVSVTSVDGINYYGDIVTVSAVTNSGIENIDSYEFRGWYENGRQVSQDAQYSFKAYADRNLRALYAADPVILTVSTNDKDMGVAAITEGLPWGNSDKQRIVGEIMEKNSEITVKATPNQGYKFVRWENGRGVELSTSEEYKFTIVSSVAIVAMFEKIPSSQGGGGGGGGGGAVTPPEEEPEKPAEEDVPIDETAVVTVDEASGTTHIKCKYDDKLVADTDNIVAYYIDDNGKKQIIPNGFYNKALGEYQFVTWHKGPYYLTVNKTVFNDTEGHWGENAILFMSSRNIVNGMGDGAYNPEGKTTRTQIIKMLAMMAEADLSVHDGKYSTEKFDDVPQQAWYKTYLDWSLSNKLITGVSDSAYNPEGVITREQMAVLIVRYSQMIGFTLPEIKEKLKFADADEMIPFYREAVEKIEGAGIINGRPNGSFDGNEGLTRAETATVLMNYIKIFALR